MKEGLIQKLFTNSCSQEELQTLLQLINDDPTPPSSMLMKKLYESINHRSAPHARVKNRIYSQVLDRLEESGPPVGIEKNRVYTSRKTIRYSIAASLIVLIGLAVWMFSGIESEQVVRTNYGQQYALRLSDGSKVRLNANSRLVYHKTWSSGEDRAVWLDGEAFFEVEKKPAINQKFQVITKDLTIEVLGTTFNVNSHRDKTSVYLQEGSIRLYLNVLDTVLLLNAGELLVYSEESKIIERKEGISSEYHTSWKDGVLIFRNAPLREVLEKIEETYGVQFKVANAAHYEREINYPLPIDELETALSILKKTVDGLKIRQEEDTIYLE